MAKIFKLTKPPEGGPSFSMVDADGNDVGTFRCVSELPGVAIAALVASASSEPSMQASSAVEFIQSAIHPDDEIAFRRVIYGKTPVITADILAEIVSYLVEEYFNRPLGKSSGSQPTGTSTNSTSEES